MSMARHEWELLTFYKLPVPTQFHVTIKFSGLVQTTITADAG
jgi:hypothetical protein